MSVLKNIKLFKNIFITSGITFVFGIYSIYHLYFYIHHIEYTHNAEINKLQKRINKMENDYNDLKLELNSKVSNIENNILTIEQTHMYSNDISSEISSDISSNCENKKYLETELEYNEQINAIKKIGYTCIEMNDLFEPNSDDERALSDSKNYINNDSRSRSVSWSSLSKRFFG